MVIVFGYKFICATFALTIFAKEPAKADLKVLSYNVRVFNTYNHLKEKNPSSSKEMIKWVSDDDADIKKSTSY